MMLLGLDSKEKRIATTKCTDRLQLGNLQAVLGHRISQPKVSMVLISLNGTKP